MAKTQRYTAQEIIDALNHTKGMQYLAARTLGCTYQTIQNYIKRYPSVAEAARYHHGEMVDTAELKLWESIQKGESWGISLCLRTLGKDRGYGDEVTVTMKQAEGLVKQYLELFQRVVLRNVSDYELSTAIFADFAKGLSELASDGRTNGAAVGRS